MAESKRFFLGSPLPKKVICLILKEYYVELTLLSVHRASLSELPRRPTSPCALPRATSPRPAPPRLAHAVALSQAASGQTDLRPLRHPSAPYPGRTGLDPRGPASDPPGPLGRYPTPRPLLAAASD